MNFGQNPTVRVSRETPSEIAPGLGDQIMVLEGMGLDALPDDELFRAATSLAFWGGLLWAGIGHFGTPRNIRRRNQGLVSAGGSLVVRMVARAAFPRR